MLFAQQQRLKVMNQIKQTFIEAAKQDLGLKREELISEICMTHGSTRRKALEYIQELKSSGFIEEDETGLWLSEKFKVLSVQEEADKKMKEVTESR